MPGIKVRGFAEFRRDLKRVDADARRRMDKRFRQAAGLVVTEARGIAEAKGLRRTGDLIRGIRPYVTARGAGVRSTSRHRGYPYPLRLEFENRVPGGTGPRASLYPAFEHVEKEVQASLEGVLDDVIDDLAH